MSVAEAPAESPLRAAFIGVSHDHAWGKAEAIRRRRRQPAAPAQRGRLRPFPGRGP